MVTAQDRPQCTKFLLRKPLVLRKRGGSMSLMTQMRANVVGEPSSVAMGVEAPLLHIIP
jgi:hypothetical protein